MTTETASPERTLLHTRQITCRGYKRSDGLYDIEGDLKDVVPRETHLHFKVVPAGECIHHMRLVMTIDDTLVIRDLRARMDATPTPYCAHIEANYAALKGVSITPGFRQRIRDIVGGTRGCTHVTDLLDPMATTAVQTLHANVRFQSAATAVPRVSDARQPPAKLLDSCHGWRADGPAVRIVWPDFDAAQTRRVTAPPGATALDDSTNFDQP